MTELMKTLTVGSTEGRPRWRWVHRCLVLASRCASRASPRIPPRASPRVTSTIHMTCIANSLARSGFHQLSAHAGQGPALQPRDVHLGEADPGRNGVLMQVLKEPQHNDLTLQLRQSCYQAGQGQQVLGLLPGCRRGHQIAKAKVGFVASWLVQR